MDAQYRVGINYWPSRTAMRWWHLFDRAAVERDFAAIAGAGCDCVRIFLLWEDFQPSPTVVTDLALARLVAVADIAAANGLALVPTLFTGHMSGANWLPEWALRDGPAGRFPLVSGDRVVPGEPRNWYADAAIGDAQVLFAREAASALRGHPALWAWDLGNENSNVCIPATRDEGRAWLWRMTDAIRSVDPTSPVTIGLHMEDLEQDRRIGPAEAAATCDFLCMHGYPMYAPWARSPVDAQLPSFLAEVTRFLGGKDVFFEEFGMPTRTSDEEDSADVFVAEALDGLYEAGTIGAMLWCFADYAPELWDAPPLDTAPHERFFGLWRADGTPKPAARNLARYRGLARRMRRVVMDWGGVTADRYYEEPLANLRAMYDRYAREAVPR